MANATRLGFAGLATGLFGAGSVLLGGGVAGAQTLPTNIEPTAPQPLDDTPVLERERPEFQPIGIQLAAFTLLPKIAVGGNYNDNIYATRSGTTSDFGGSLGPEFTLQSDWSRNALKVHFVDVYNRYANHPDEDVNSVHGDILGRYDGPDDLAVNAEADFTQAGESRTNPGSPEGVVRPIIYDQAHAELQALKTFNRLRLTLDSNYYDYTYQNGAAANGATVLESIYNVQNVFLSGKAEYAVTPTTGLVFAVDGNTRDYPNKAPGTTASLNSSGVDVSGGLALNLSHLIRGEVLFGYLEQSYTSHEFQSVSGGSAHVKLTYLPTGLTTLSLSVDRTISNTQAANSASALTTDGKFEIDHELLRNLILIGSVDFGQDQYMGISRTDKRVEGEIGANYLMNRHITIKLNYDQYDLTSSGVAARTNYDIGQFNISLIFAI